MTPRIALVSAIFGGVDSFKEIPVQSIPCEAFYFSEDNCPVPLFELNEILKARYCKTQTHRLLPDYDVYIWVDGSVQITSPDFVRNFLEPLGKNGIVIYHHYKRHSFSEEVEHIEREIVVGNRYLTKRYKGHPLRQQVNYYREHEYPDVYGLYATGLFARLNLPLVNAMFDEWWNEILLWSNYDQFAFSYLAWKHGISIYGRKWNHDEFHLVMHESDKQYAQMQAI